MAEFYVQQELFWRPRGRASGETTRYRGGSGRVILPKIIDTKREE